MAPESNAGSSPLAVAGVGTSSALVQVTCVPTDTTTSLGWKLKLSIFTWTAADCGAGCDAGPEAMAAPCAADSAGNCAMALWNTTPANTTETMIAEHCAVFIVDSCKRGLITPASMRLVNGTGYSIKSWILSATGSR